VACTAGKFDIVKYVCTRKEMQGLRGKGEGQGVRGKEPRAMGDGYVAKSKAKGKGQKRIEKGAY
jgi:hypothetical protein